MEGYRESLKPSEALNLLEEVGCDRNVISHSLSVSRLAKELAEKIRSRGHPVDVDFVEVAGLLHDIGRSRTHGILHGVEGGRILREKGLQKCARVCERHIGAGLTSEEARELGLPRGEYIPETLEEKIIAHADNLTLGEKNASLDEALAKFRLRLGESHPAIRRIKELSDLIESYT